MNNDLSEIYVLFDSIDIMLVWWFQEYNTYIEGSVLQSIQSL